MLRSHRPQKGGASRMLNYRVPELLIYSFRVPLLIKHHSQLPLPVLLLTHPLSQCTFLPCLPPRAISAAVCPNNVNATGSSPPNFPASCQSGLYRLIQVSS